MKRVPFKTLDEFLDHLKAARGFLRGEAPKDEVTVEGAQWRGHSATLHGACAEMIERDSKKRHFSRLTFTSKDMKEDEERLKALETAEGAVEETLTDLRAEKEAVKARMAGRSGLTLSVVEAKLADPLADRAELDDLKVLSARPRAIVAGYNDGVAAARRRTEARNEDASAVSADRDRLRLENKVLRGGALTVDDVALSAPRRSRRSRSR